MSLISRRRFLGGIVAAAGLGGAGVVAYLTRSQESAVAAGTTTSTSTTAQPTPTTSATTTTARTTTTANPPTTDAPFKGVNVICREAWGALPVAGEFVSHTIDRITVHHTAVVLEDNSDAPGRMRQHQEFHQSRGWPDLAYHYIIDAGGNVYEGRPVESVGDTGTDYDPTGHFLVCCEGDFNQQQITDDQYAALVRMVAWGAREFDVDPRSVQGHRDLASTSCPGDSLYALIADGTLAADAAQAEVDGLVRICDAAGAELVSAIESQESGTN